MCKLPGCNINHPGWVNCKVAARSAVVNVVVDKPQNKPDLVVNKSRTKDRHKKVRREYFRNYMAILRQTPKAVSAGIAEYLPYLKPPVSRIEAP